MAKKKEKKNSMEYRNDRFPGYFYLCNDQYRFIFYKEELTVYRVTKDEMTTTFSFTELP